MKIQKNTICVATLIFVLTVIEIIAIKQNKSLFVSKAFIPIIWQLSYFIILAVSLNLILKQMGQLSLGHCGFMAVGAYTSALISLAIERSICGYELYASGKISSEMYRSTVADYRETAGYAVIVLIAITSGALLTAAAGFLCAVPAMRMKGDYLAVITLGFGMIIVNVINNLAFAGGDGLEYGNASSALYKTGLGFSNKLLCNYVWIALMLTFLSVSIIYLYSKSNFGRKIRAIRDDEIAAGACGIDVTETKIVTFVISAFFAGVAGGIYSCCTKSISTVDFAFSNSGILNSVFIVVIVILGGESIIGSVISASSLYCINYFIKQSGLQNIPGFIGAFFGYPMLCYAIILIVVVLIKSNGITPGKFIAKVKLKIKGDKRVDEM